MVYDDYTTYGNGINRRKVLRGMAIGGATLTGAVGTGSAQLDWEASGNADQEFANSRFKKRPAALGDVSVIKESNALRDLRQKISDSTGRTVENVLPLSLELTTNNEDVNALNPSLAVSLLKDTSTPWENTTPQDLGVLVAGVVDEPESGVNSGDSVQANDGTGRIPVSAGAVTLHGNSSDSASLSRSKDRTHKTAESNDEVQYELFSYEEGNEVVQNQQQGQLPNTTEPVGTVSSQSSELPSSLTPEVVESYQNDTGVSTQGLAGRIGCTTCTAVIPAICAGTSQLGFYGCATRCVPYATTYPVLAGACGVFCRYVTTVQGAALCAASPAIICAGAFGC
ncbi:hypothetical protein [Natrinema sp. DC36]|uniref:hypothetical protein n=1 Tax=Natrinema sp. DC36 TaxID=2878680 RepID=UPI001CF06C8E|nr:hypothetical protein [Natrinema sp. DC36]